MTLHNIIDSHFHSDCMNDKGLDSKAQLDLCFREGFEGGIDIGCTSDDLPRRYELLKDYPNVVLAGAIGPWELDTITNLSFEEIDSRLAVLRGNLIKYKAKILGEIGLDYYWNYGTTETQKYLFESQLKMACEFSLPVAIHERMAQSDTIDIISRLTPPKSGIIHCFDGCEELMKTALDLGYFISFAGNLTFKKNTDLRDLLKKVPLNRLLFETDAPYLTPVPHRGQLNTPLYVVHTYECASQILGLSMEALSSQVLENYRSLLAR